MTISTPSPTSHSAVISFFYLTHLSSPVSMTLVTFPTSLAANTKFTSHISHSIHLAHHTYFPQFVNPAHLPYFSTNILPASHTPVLPFASLGSKDTSLTSLTLLASLL
eukprot:GHVN01042075.1.p3 GENE.GHVN01042075.1~~GHVN01042075.1.p3  ORF type:complete len:108 (-),score=33.35 GHVN01042075.1:502-825(-)